MPEIRLVNVSKSYGPVEVCRRINLSIADREFVTLLGSSGCGKTTTLNMVAGLDEVSDGDILMDGRRVNDLEPIDRDVAMVFQNYALYPHMTVAQNIGFTLKLKGVAPAEIAARVATAAESLDLGNLLDRYPAQLSGGQQQRVAIGRAIVRAPKVFLFDEPFSNLDATLRNKMRAEVKQLHARLGVTSIFVTHDQEEALSISDRVAIMRQGVVEQYGTPEEVYLAPATTYVARFIGNPQIEILPASLKRDGPQVFCAIGAARVALIPAQIARLERHEGEIDVAVRPEHVALDDAGIPATIRIAQPSGPSTVVTLDWPGGTVFTRMNGIARLQPGTNVHATIDVRHLMFFDRRSGHLIATSG
jgi:ABC-type sugar transport system ATPase subunit